MSKEKHLKFKRNCELASQLKKREVSKEQGL